MVRDYILDACAVREWDGGGGPSDLLDLHNKVAKIMISQGGLFHGPEPLIKIIFVELSSLKVFSFKGKLLDIRINCTHTLYIYLRACSTRFEYM